MADTGDKRSPCMGNLEKVSSLYVALDRNSHNCENQKPPKFTKIQVIKK